MMFSSIYKTHSLYCASSSLLTLLSLSLAPMPPSPPFSSRLLLLSLLLLFCNGVHSKSKSPSSPVSSKIGQGYRLISVQQTPDGALLGRLQVKQPNKIYGPDIPYLQLFVKYVHFHFMFCFLPYILCISSIFLIVGFFFKA